MNYKTIISAVVGGFVGWKVAERFSSGTLVEVGGAVVGGVVGVYVGQKL